MKIEFEKDKITVNEKSIMYDDLKKDDGHKTLINLLEICVTNMDNLEFICDDNCPPFGKKLKQIIENEFAKQG